MQQKREEFNRRESANESRRQQLADTAAKDELRKQEDERRKELERQVRWRAFINSVSDCVPSIRLFVSATTRVVGQH